jgi:hypothetical protein
MSIGWKYICDVTFAHSPAGEWTNQHRLSVAEHAGVPEKATRDRARQLLFLPKRSRKGAFNPRLPD